MVFRLVYKRGLLPISVRSFILHTIAFAALLCILAIGLRILAPIHAFHPASPPPPTLVPHRSFVVLSVDDFGRWTDSVPLFPGHHFMANHSDLIIQNNFWYRRATVETRQDLQNLEQALIRLNQNVSFEHRAVLTPHWIVGGPDFDAMRAAGCNAPPPPTPDPHTNSHPSPSSHRDDNFPRPSDQNSGPSGLLLSLERGFSIPDSFKGPLSAAAVGSGGEFDSCVYKEQLLSDAGPTGLDQAPYHRGDLRESYTSLWKKGLWHPEYHGRSHFSVSKWLKLLRTDRKTQACFRNNLVCATDTTQLRSEFNGFSNKAELKTWLEEGINAFSAFWGYRPALISSPHNTWSGWLSDVALDLSFIGAELAEDQASYVQHEKSLSMHDRYRFDVFFPGFDCDTAIDEVKELLSVPVEKSLTDHWYDFLSMIDLFRNHHRPYHHGIGGNHQRFISLMWHAQNAMSSTYSAEEHAGHMQCMERAVRAIRESRPRAVFVTGSELHQIRSRGWSQEIWSDSIILRNYGTNPVHLHVPDLRDLYPKSKSWRGKKVLATLLSADGRETRLETHETPPEHLGRREVLVGEQIQLAPDSVVELTSA